MPITYKSRTSVLARLGFQTYAEYLASPLWEKARRRARNRHGDHCVCCRAKATEFHHQSYGLKTLMGDNSKDVLPVCNGCHKRIEFNSDGSKRTFDEARKAFIALRDGRPPDDGAFMLAGVASRAEKTAEKHGLDVRIVRRGNAITNRQANAGTFASGIAKYIIAHGPAIVLDYFPKTKRWFCHLDFTAGKATTLDIATATAAMKLKALTQ